MCLESRWSSPRNLIRRVVDSGKVNGERTCIKSGLLPANIQSIVNTNAARPKMTGIDAVGRSILAVCVSTIFKTTIGRLRRMFSNIGTRAWENSRYVERRKKKKSSRNRKQNQLACETDSNRPTIIFLA